MSSSNFCKIRSITTRAVLAPLTRPINTASGALQRAPLVLIDVTTEEGLVGRAYVMAFDVSLVKVVASLIETLGQAVIGDEVAPWDIAKKLRARFTLFGGTRGFAGVAISGIDMAVWDILAQSFQKPLARVIGGAPRAIRAYNSLGLVAPDAAEAELEGVLKDGFKAIKIKLGWPTLAADIASVRAIRRCIPDDVEIMADYNQSLTVAEAIRRGQALDDEGLRWIEEPTRCNDYEGHARIRAAVRTPIQLGENFAGPEDMQAAIAAGASDLVMPDAQQIGGVTGWLQASTLASSAGLPCSAHVFLELSCHLMTVTPSCDWLEYYDIAGAILEEQPTVVDGKVTAPEKPGVGIAWNEAAITSFAIN